MDVKNDYSKHVGKRVYIQSEGFDRPLNYNGIILSVGSQLITIKDDKDGAVDIPLDKILFIIPKEEKK